MNEPRLSFVIPTLNEADALPALLGDLRPVRVPHEILVVDGGSTDSTIRLAADAGATVISAPRGRGCQLRIGGSAARGGMLCFLHADVRIGADARAAIERLVATPGDEVFAFSLRIGSTARRYRIVERAANLRSRVARLPYGDQGLLLSREVYARSGGFRDIPLMEDVAMIRSLRSCGRIRVLDECVEVSARRWEADGIARRTLRNWKLLLRYFLGASPSRLAAEYSARVGGSADGVVQ